MHHALPASGERLRRVTRQCQRGETDNTKQPTAFESVERSNHLSGVLRSELNLLNPPNRRTLIRALRTQNDRIRGCPISPVSGRRPPVMERLNYSLHHMVLPQIYALDSGVRSGNWC